ncbi:uncharacterized protein LOC134220695 [Armigeres subalbatus]|uniref:uncharacterized protein LOC134220695 n=1 Tax=Armigeres subalbatus TaxID=124917 RepID=UPI002ED35D80
MAGNCIRYVPTTEEYFSEYSTPLAILLAVSGGFLVLIAGLFYQIVRTILVNYAKHCQVELIIANVIYTVIVIFCIISLAVPVVSEQFGLATLIVFSWCIFSLYRYIVLTAGGHNALRQMYQSGSERLASGGLIRRLLYRIFGSYNITRICIIQFPIISTVQSVCQIVLHLVDRDEYYNNLYTLLIISIVSIILYLISFSLLVYLIQPGFPDLQIVKKFKYLRLVVLVIKLQVAILEAIFRGVYIDCTEFPGTAWSLMNLAKQPLIILQMIVLAFATWRVYRNEKNYNAS